MKILLSNDDGYQAPGINYLAEVLSDIAEVIVIAPDRNRSGASNSLTLDRPLRLQKVRQNFYTVNGTPTDCVHLAVTGVLKVMPDMVVSGINEGPNMGDDIFYSGTVAAAMEGRSLGLPSLAISLNWECKHYDTAAFVTKDLVEKAANSDLPSHTILNINVPDLPISELNEYEVTRLGRRHRAQPSVKMRDPRGHEMYWVGLAGSEADAGAGTDFHALRAGNVSVTPLRLEWTDFESFDHVSTWMSALNKGLKNKDA